MAVKKDLNAKSSLHIKIPDHISYIILAIAAIFGVYFVYALVLPVPIPNNLQINGQGNPNYLPQTQAPTLRPVPTPSIAPTVYTSKKLGVSFNYIADLGVEQVYVKEIGNRIYLYSGNQKPEEGKYVEVLLKERGDTLQQALQKKIQKDGLTQSCKATADSPQRNMTFVFDNGTYEVGYISALTTNPDAPYEVLWAQKKKCDPTYNGGLDYYLSDSKHSAKLLYFSIGQDNFVSNSGGWDNTVQFLD